MQEEHYLEDEVSCNEEQEDDFEHNGPIHLPWRVFLQRPRLSMAWDQSVSESSPMWPLTSTPDTG